MTDTQNDRSTPQKPYNPPAIIYEGQISTRAGSPVGPIAPSDSQDVDPIDLFNNQDGA